MRASRADPDIHSAGSVVLTQELISDFLDRMGSSGAAKSTLDTYRRQLALLYELLPEDKRIRSDSINAWRDELFEQGYAWRTVGKAVSAANSFLAWLGRRELQGDLHKSHGEDIQPELTRNEYLRLLSTARNLGKERVYLLIKVFATTSISLQNLSKLTVEAVQENRVQVVDHGCPRLVHIPACVRTDLLSYAKKKGILHGPIFITRNGKPLNRATVSMLIGRICRDAQVPREKGNPRCLKRLYQTTQASIEANIALLVEQAHDRMIETEQLTVGWDFEKASGL